MLAKVATMKKAHPPAPRTRKRPSVLRENSQLARPPLALNVLYRKISGPLDQKTITRIDKFVSTNQPATARSLVIWMCLLTSG